MIVKFHLSLSFNPGTTYTWFRRLTSRSLLHPVSKKICCDVLLLPAIYLVSVCGV